MTEQREFDAAALPVFEPDAALWGRIVAARRRQVVRRRVGAFAGLAASVAVGVVATMLAMPVHQDGAGSRRTAQDESRVLEEEWAKLVSGGTAAQGTDRVRAIDAALQAVYDRGGSDEETAPLWSQRNRALRALIATGRDGAIADIGPTRI